MTNVALIVQGGRQESVRTQARKTIRVGVLGSGISNTKEFVEETLVFSLRIESPIGPRAPVKGELN